MDGPPVQPQIRLNDPNYPDWTTTPSATTTPSDITVALEHISTRRTSLEDAIDDKSEDQISYHSKPAEYEWDGSLEEDSPYPEVRAAVSNLDDPNIPTNTFRMWSIGLLFTILVSGLNQFFSMRYPSVTITALISQLLSLPCGKILELILPARTFRIFGYEFSLNPGPFNIKEHVLITTMSNVVYDGAYATEIIATQHVFYNQKWGILYQFCLVLSTQLIGFSFAGVCRRFLVWPSSMIWPSTLVNASLFNTLHSSYGGFDDNRISRERFFSYFLLGSFFWYWFPGYLFTGLSYFSFICWIWPENVVVNQLFGYENGLGMNSFTLDWAVVSYTGSPLVTPWWAELNVFAAIVLFYWIICPALYYSNIFFASHLPMSKVDAFNRFGKSYNATQVVIDGVLDDVKYKQYSPLYLPITFALSYGLSFATLTSTLVHTWLWYRKDIAHQLRSSLKDEPDVHARLMLAYPEVPQWHYITVGVVSVALGIVTITVWDTKLPVWAFVVAVMIALLYTVPIGMLQAITNVQVGLNVFTELIIGYILPGRPVAMMIFKTFGYITMTQALNFVSDLKLGHYMKIPPRMMFMVQTVATVVASFVVVGVQEWMFCNIPNICTPDQIDGFKCPHIRTFGVASLIFGSVGPRRMFSPGATYHPLLYFFILGAALPIPFYFLARRWPNSWYKYVNIPIFFTGTGVMPPASGVNFSTWALVGFIFQYWVRRHHFRWWSSYNYVLSAALDSGVAIAVVVIFFTLQLPNHKGIDLNWWGNTITNRTADHKGTAYRPVPSDKPFGPAVGSWQ